jgi:hypothetical protein
MTGKRSRITGTPTAAMQAWMSSGLNGLDMFKEEAPPAVDPPSEGISSSDSAPPGHSAAGASEDTAHKGVDLQLVSKKVVECSATVDAKQDREGCHRDGRTCVPAKRLSSVAP